MTLSSEVEAKPAGVAKTLRDQERLSRLARFAIDQAAEAIFWAQEQGKFVYVNDAACRLLGYTSAELLQMSVWDVDTGLKAEAWRGAWEQAKKEEVMRLESTCRARDGRLIPVEITIKHLEAEGTQFTCAYVRDVSARKQLEDQFRQAQKLEAVGRLAGGIAHDFNNLLTVINGYSSLLLDRLPATSTDRSALLEVAQAGTRAAALTRQLLAFSRKQVIQPVVLDLNQVLAGMGKMLTRLLGEDILVNIRTDRELGKIKADPGEIEQVVMNLSVNARDAMRDGGKLTLETINVDLVDEHLGAHLGLRKGRYVLLSISDTGCGMDAETQSHLFEPFFTTKEQGKGTGLGLSTVYGIVSRSGGRISCQSEVGRGTTFAIMFPQCEDPVEAAKGEAAPKAVRGAETILLAEDEMTVRTLARMVLERYGYRVIEAYDGREALKLASSHREPIDLLVTDMVMPGMNGLKLIQEFSPLHPGAGILVMSGYNDAGLSDTEIRRRGISYIQKPFLPQALATRVREILDRRASRVGGNKG